MKKGTDLSGKTKNEQNAKNPLVPVGVTNRD
jgi:hypothetical protein